MPGFAHRIRESLAERFASTWVLLSDTTNFLSRTSVSSTTSRSCGSSALRLSSHKDDDTMIREVGRS